MANTLKDVPNLKVKDKFVFGKYAGNNIKWRILDKKDNKALILTDNIIEAKRFDEKSNNYENSEIRAWLNNEFYNMFTDEEKAKILLTEVDNGPEQALFQKNPLICPNTKDYFFLLSQKEAESIFKTEPSRKAKGLPNAQNNGLELDKDGFGCWMLRTSFYTMNELVLVVCDDGVPYSEFVNKTYFGVRAACWIQF